MSVSHGCMNVGMSQQCLDGGQIDAGHNQVGGVSVPEHMDGNVFFNSGYPGGGFEFADHVVLSQGIPLGNEDVRVLRLLD